jgi:murein L,D-transpeptidase YcbB/YkuD
MKLVALGLAMAGSLLISACGRGAGGLSSGDVDLALETLKSAPQHGLDAEQFHVSRIEDLLKSDRTRGVSELRTALADYAEAQHGETIPRSAFPEPWGLKPAAYDGAADLDQALRSGKFKDWLTGLPSPIPEYRTLQKAYVAYLRLAAAGGWPALDAHAAPQAIQQRLAVEDPQAASLDVGTALQRFQTAHGLKPTGNLDAATLHELNVPAIARAAQIRANLERLRWLPRDEPATRVDVNTASATMSYYRDGQMVMHMLSASGRPGGDETPMLASAIDGIVLNPPWNVPDEIAQEEIIPKGEAYLQAKGFVTKDNGHLMQQPGPDAALGLVKFDFDNPYAVYLHDTPAKAAFNQQSRAVSHGCVRLAQAVEFAKVLLSQQRGWSPERVDETLASGETTHVKLAHKTPVRLLYLTAISEGDHVAFRPDIYGWDRQLLELLDHPPAKPKKAQRKA